MTNATTDVSFQLQEKVSVDRTSFCLSRKWDVNLDGGVPGVPSQVRKSNLCLSYLQTGKLVWDTVTP